MHNKKYRIYYSVHCIDEYYIDLEAESEEKAKELFDSGYWDISEPCLHTYDCYSSEIEKIEEIDDKD